MGRKKRIAQIRQLEQRLRDQRLHCREAGTYPMRVIRRYRAGIVLITGLSLGLLSGRVDGRRMMSAALSYLFAFIKLELPLLQK